jgi:hypothetical protein
MKSMQNLLKIILVGVGLINFYPLIGVISAEQISTLYGIDPASVDTVILLRHRAVLFGLLGGFIIYSASNRALRKLACISGLVSMLAYIALMATSTGYGESIVRIALIDAFACVGLLFVFIVEMRPAGRRS